MAQRVLATMITTTTFGTWLPGDLRGYVEKGVILPGDPGRLELSKSRMNGTTVFLTSTEQSRAYAALLDAVDEFEYRLLAASVESWHVHALVNHGYDKVETAAGRLKNRMRQAVGRGKIWTAGYDKRYCFTEEEVTLRGDYINRHKGARAIPIR